MTITNSNTAAITINNNNNNSEMSDELMARLQNIHLFGGYRLGEENNGNYTEIQEGEGGFYVAKEWDETYVPIHLYIEGEEVAVITYRDGLQHRVSIRYAMELIGV